MLLRLLLELIKRALSWLLSLAEIVSRLKESILTFISDLSIPKRPWKAYFAAWTITIVFIYNIFFLLFTKEPPSRPWFFSVFALLVFMSAVVLAIYNGLTRRRGVNRG